MEGTRFKLYPQASFSDPYANLEVVWVSSPAGSVSMGPSDHRMYTMIPVDKEDPYGIAPAHGVNASTPPWDGLIEAPAVPDADGHFDYLEPGSLQFEAAHLFGSVRFVLDIWEGYFDRLIPWHSDDHYERIELSVLPSLENAHSGYGFLEIGGNRDHGEYHSFSLNFDVIAHEVGHAFIYSEVGVPDPGKPHGEYFGFHESASDLVALISSLHFESVTMKLLESTRGNLYTLNSLNRMGELAVNDQIRVASNTVKLSDFADGWKKEHKLSEPLTGAFFDIFVDMFHERLLDFGVIDQETEDLSDLLLRKPEYAEVMQARFDAAYPLAPDLFRRALLDARDILGTYLADTWQNLDRNALTFADVADTFEAVDVTHSGGRFRRAIRQNFEMRDIGVIPVGPRLAAEAEHEGHVH